LIITRRIASDVDVAEVYPPGDFDEHDSHSMRLLSHDALSPRELQVLALLGSGMNLHEAATVLGLSEKTIDNHRASMYHKLSIHDRAELHAIAARAGLTVRDADRQRL
jgi:DNA-binding NarL/FixJ family response regulator